MLENMKRLIVLLLRVSYTLKYRILLSFNRIEADYVLWCPDFFSLRNFYGDNLQKIYFIYYYLKREKRSVTIYTKRDVGRFRNKTVIYFGSHYYNTYEFENYSNALKYITANLEYQGNSVFPNSNEIQYWEDKCLMHELFDNLGIRTPRSVIVETAKISGQNFDYPMLVKESYSCSGRGIHRVDSVSELDALVTSKKFFKANTRFVAQILLNIKRDLRVILVDGAIVLHYWRINRSPEWKPTSTGYGSSVDFESFPENWREWIVAAYKKLNLRTCAFDIAWNNDDLESEPFILEVSVFYQANPVPKLKENLDSYGRWKKSISLKDSYQKACIEIIMEVQEKFVRTLL